MAGVRPAGALASRGKAEGGEVDRRELETHEADCSQAEPHEADRGPLDAPSCDRKCRETPVRRVDRAHRAEGRNGQGGYRRRRDPRLTPVRFTAVIFDLDGVLVDTEIWWDEVRLAFAARRGLAWTVDDRAAVMGQNSRGWSAVMRDRLGLDEPLEAIEREVVDAMVARFATHPSPVIPGTVETVTRLRRSYRLGLASSAHPSAIAAALRTIGLEEAFQAVVSSDEVEHGKPSPDVYLLAAERLDVPAAECLVIEDSLNGVLAGRAAGMTVVLVPNASVPPPPGTADAANLSLPALADIDPADIARILPARQRRSPATVEPPGW
jgi:HAD superfamily hydrolase (TIGR01509 family)